MLSDPYGISAAALATSLACGEPWAALDVRESWERDYCSIPLPATTIHLHIPLAQVPDRINEVLIAAQGRVLVVYCHHGVRSRRVADWLRDRREGEVWNLEGGIDNWSRAIDSSVRRY